MVKGKRYKEKPKDTTLNDNIDFGKAIKVKPRAWSRAPNFTN